MNTPSDRERRFTAVYTDSYASYADVLRFVQRRVEAGAEHVVAEAMTVVWRRVDELPDSPDDARAWIFGIARHCLLNSRRTDRRRDSLGVRLAQVDEGSTDPTDHIVSRVDLARAWARLAPGGQEDTATETDDGPRPELDAGGRARPESATLTASQKVTVLHRRSGRRHPVARWALPAAAASVVAVGAALSGVGHDGGRRPLR